MDLECRALGYLGLPLRGLIRLHIEALGQLRERLI